MRRIFEDEDVYVAEEKEYRSRRDHYQILENLPTWNDAEVQVLDPVHPGLITTVLVGDARTKTWAEGLSEQLGLSCSIVVEDGLAL